MGAKLIKKSIAPEVSKRKKFLTITSICVGGLILAAIVFYWVYSGGDNDKKMIATYRKTGQRMFHSQTTLGEGGMWSRVEGTVNTLRNCSHGTITLKAGGRKARANFLALGGTRIVTVSHIFLGLPKDVEVTLEKQKASVIVTKLSECHYKIIGGMDLAFIDIPGYSSRKITSKFMKVDDLPRHPEGVYSMHRDGNVSTMLPMEDCNLFEDYINIECETLNGETRTVKHSAPYYVALGMHAEAYCGNPYVWAGGDQQHQILGIHVSGKGDYSYFAPITQEILELSGNLPVRFEERGGKIGTIGESLVFAEDVPEACPRGANYIGTVSPQGAASMALISDIVPTPLQEEFRPTTGPLNLRPFEREGEVYRPLDYFIAKLEKPVHLGDFGTVNKWCGKLWMEWDRPSVRASTWEEALNGVTGSTLRPMTVSTSAGHLFRHAVKKGKFPLVFFDPEEEKFKMSTAMAEHMERYEEYCKEHTAPNLMKDQLKDERKPLADVHRGKARIFSGSQVDFLIMYRKIFNPWMDMIRRRTPFSPVSIGMDATGSDFHYMFKYLRGACEEPKWMAGDVKGWDLCIPYAIHRCLVENMIAWTTHHFPELDPKLVRNVAEASLTHFHIIFKTIYARTGGIGSGHAATAEENTMMHCILIRVVFCVLAEETHYDCVQMFKEVVRFVCYGDDHLIAVDAKEAPFFNMINIRKTLKELFHMEYTMPDKTPISEPYMLLDEVEYLKRKPVRPEGLLGYTIGRLPIEVCVDIALWTRKSAIKALGRGPAYNQNLDSSLRELFFHGETVFNEYLDKFNRFYAGSGVKSYLTYERLMEEYKSTFPKT